MKTIDASPIRPNLYIGGRPPIGHYLRKAGFDVLVLCAEELQFPASDFPGVEVQRIPLDDDDSKPVGIQDWHNIVRMGERVSRRIRNGKRVLVTCAMGLNRSAIVTATAVHFLTGASGCEAGGYVQRRRVVGGQHALFNGAFVKALCTRLPSKASLVPIRPRRIRA